MRYFFHISFKGTHFSGWQRQRPGVESVQEKMEVVLQKLLGTEIGLMGCGRTDAGVHASQFFAHLDAESMPDLKKLNYALPNDIVVHDIIPVAPDAHARYDALSRTYTYLLHDQKNPYKSELSTFVPQPIIFKNKIEDACKCIIKSKDFRSFCKTPERHNTTICEVTDCRWTFLEKGQMVFTITANRFLKSMVRILVHDLILLGTGELTTEEFNDRLLGDRKGQIHKIAYPQGLYLSKVTYKRSALETEIPPLIVPHF